jgi:hypothetical protein
VLESSRIHIFLFPEKKFRPPDKKKALLVGLRKLGRPEVRRLLEDRKTAGAKL